MGFALNARDLERLVPVHPDLVTIVKEASRLSPVPFTVAQTLRTAAVEAQMVAAGKSLTMNSLHLAHTYAGVAGPVCTAVDLVLEYTLANGLPAASHALDWTFKHYAWLNATMQQAAANRQLHVEWGGGWTDLKDGDHWQLPRALYRPVG